MSAAHSTAEQDQTVSSSASSSSSSSTVAHDGVLTAEHKSALEPAEQHDIFTKDFGFLHIPRYLRHDPERPAQFSLITNVTMGFSATFIIANLYWCQPLLIQFSETFNVSYDDASHIPTLTQAGYFVGIVTLTSLGDLVRRRPLILLLVFLSASFTIGLAITPNMRVFEVFSFLVGLFSVVPQILMPLAADLAPPERRASALSIVLAGILLGVLVARVLSGIIGQFASWRVVYYLAIALQYLVWLLFYLTLPDYPARNKDQTYFGILTSMAKFWYTEPLLFQATMINLPSSACFTNFWVTLTFLLGGAPYEYSTLVIGLFGLVGIFGVLMTPLVGRAIDGLIPWFAALISVCSLLVFQAIQVGAGGINVAAVIIVCFGIDVFRQMLQVSLASAVFELDSRARARLNAVLLISMFIGQVMGTIVGSYVFNKYGWRASAACSLAWTGFMLIASLARGPHVPRYTWFGYQGGCEVRKSKLAARGSARDAEAAAADAKDAESTARVDDSLDDSRTTVQVEAVDSEKKASIDA
ncbi:major facilitator superfamily domain-containing protein [Amylocystis lapponica]|nr:major facilitator superfamily domain-containing protein [Amylocystis lapponica]